MSTLLPSIMFPDPGCIESAPWIIAVHGGAGYHSRNPNNEKLVKSALRKACNTALISCKQKGISSACVDAVESAICVLEDSECLNAGTGSNLTYNGFVECDASIMDGESQLFGSVGTLKGIKNPIKASRVIMENTKIPHPLGRVPPLMLVGTGAYDFVCSHGIKPVNPQELVSDNALRDWKLWKARFDDAKSSPASYPSGPLETLKEGYGRDTMDESTQNTSFLEDTVGAVSCDSAGMFSAGVSSGGLLLKYPGRIGEAAIYGAGAWAYSPIGSRNGMACSISGTGEAIIRSAFARSLIKALDEATPEQTHGILLKQLQIFCDQHGGKDGPPSVGVLLIQKDPMESESEEHMNSDSSSISDFEDTIDKNDEEQPKLNTQDYKLRLWCAFTTDSMAIGYVSSYSVNKIRTLILRHSLLKQNPSQLEPILSHGLYNQTRSYEHICIVALPLEP